MCICISILYAKLYLHNNISYPLWLECICTETLYHVEIERLMAACVLPQVNDHQQRECEVLPRSRDPAEKVAFHHEDGGLRPQNLSSWLLTIVFLHDKIALELARSPNSRFGNVQRLDECLRLLVFIVVYSHLSRGRFVFRSIISGS